MEISIRDLEPGKKYVLQARSKSATGKTSAWSTAFTHTTLSDTVAPAPVTSLTWQAVGTSFVATWVKPTFDANGKLLRDFKDYKVIVTAGLETVTYYVTQERFDFSLEVNRNAFGAPEPDLDISVQARDNTGNLSTAATANAVNAIPSDVTGLVADGVTNAVTLAWDAIADTDLKYYEVYAATSGSGFTPGPTNLVYTGNSTSFLLPSTTYVTHYFKVRALDVFNQGSANYAAASATPESSSGIDLTPPDDPTNVEVTTSSQSDGSSTITVNWDAVASSNLSDYLVRYSTDEVTWRYINVPAAQTSALISNLIPSVNYYVQVAAMSQANVKSDFVNADFYPITTAADSTAPSQPSEPTVSVNTQSAQVSHDMTKEAGGDLETDVAYLEVHASVTTGFTPSGTTLRGTIPTAGPGIDVSGVFYYATTDSTTNLYWKIIAVDRAGNKSIASNQSTGVPGLVQNQHIENATITSAKINDLEANKITAGTGIINALDVKEVLTVQSGGHVRSSDYDGLTTGWSLDNTGLFILSGSVSANALQLQDSANIIPPAFADFEFNEDYYHTSGIANTNVMTTVGTGVNVDILETDKRFGNKCLRIYNAAITNPTVHDLVLGTDGLSATGGNIELSPGVYIFSGYFKKNGSINSLLKFGFYPETGSAIVSSAATINSTSWTRFEAQLTVPSGVSRVKAYLEFGPAVSNTGYDFLVDGLQVERKMTAAITAGQWRPPSKTTIDGGQIITGSIRSSAPSATDDTQPAWSINTAGNMQVGDAIVKGVLSVGSVTSVSLNIMQDEFSSFEKDASWYLTNMQAPLGTGVSAAPATSGGAQTGSQYLRVTSSTMVGNDDLSSFGNVFLCRSPQTSSATDNLTIAPGQEYIVSYYVKNLDPAKHLKLQVGIKQPPENILEAPPIAGGDGEVDISGYTTWTRLTFVYTGRADLTSGKLCFIPYPLTGTTGFDFAIDGVMIEQRTSPSQTTASAYEAGYTESSYVASANYLPGQIGWKIDGSGNAEFNNTIIRGFLSTSSELGAIEINLLDTRPTIKFWNDDYSNFAWINVVDDVPGMAHIGINQGVHFSTLHSVDAYSRLFMLDIGSTSHLGVVKQSNQQRLGGNLSWGDDFMAVGTFDINHLPRSEFYTEVGTALGQVRNSSNVIKGLLWITDTASRLQAKTSSGVLASELYLEETNIASLSSRDGSGAVASQLYLTGGQAVIESASDNIWVRTLNRAQIVLNRSGGYITFQGGDGTALNGTILALGGNGDPYLHILNEGWNNVTVNSGSAFASNEPQVRLLPDGTCIMRGGISNHSTVINTVLATLPAGYRPARNIRCAAAAEGTDDQHHIFINASNGQIILGRTGSGGTSGDNDTWFGNVHFSTI